MSPYLCFVWFRFSYFSHFTAPIMGSISCSQAQSLGFRCHTFYRIFSKIDMPFLSQNVIVCFMMMNQGTYTYILYVYNGNTMQPVIKYFQFNSIQNTFLGNIYGSNVHSICSCFTAQSCLVFTSRSIPGSIHYGFQHGNSKKSFLYCN